MVSRCWTGPRQSVTDYGDTCTPNDRTRQRLHLRAGDTSSNAASSFDPALVALIARAHCYLRKLTKKPGRTLTDVAAECGTEPSEVSRILPLAFLAPAIVEAVLAGQQPISLTTQRLLRIRDVPACWAKQAALILESRTSNP